MRDVHLGGRDTSDGFGRMSEGKDEVTGLSFRTAFFRDFVTMCANADAVGESVSVIFGDIVNFADINERFGFAAGDMLLRQVTGRLENIMPPSAKFGRVGSNEFAVCFQTPTDDLEASVYELKKEFNRPFSVQKLLCRCHIAIGAARYVKDMATSLEAIHHATWTLKLAKSRSSDSSIFAGRVREEYLKHAQSRTAVLRALARQDVFACYQPKVNLRTGKIAGFEALMRWRDDQGITRTAAAAVEAWQNSEVAVALDHQLLLGIMEDMRAWQRRGFDFGRIAINACAPLIRREGFATELLSRIALAGLRPDHFELELIEDIFIGQRMSMIAQEVALLQEAGMTIALDDFGTGFASFSHLKQLQINTLKIDRSFVLGMADPTNAAIVRSVCDLGSQLGITTVAEGIETPSQANVVLTMGCELAQGYFFSAALPAHEVPSLPQPLLGHRSPHASGGAMGDPAGNGAVDDRSAAG